ncbi:MULTISPECIES: type II toxin-antitoxin system death-on-curing family toxin [Streptococcus]|jgi:death-on-curing protein|uniref:type II toxin-antitoxin system death-on-curing family toxin n=1 Tax=Streptococcus TaxID=1301 RepID=UPI000C18610A|nr:type II toxin-antitoxin system death-on-curing family toxin [Streptococcus suis]QEM40849.1 type II toxin-antitoxin system death-on-curing family toxin [Streptococcus phage phi-SC181]QGJ85687.1 death on curing protein [Streptococcus phage phi-SsuFJSM5_rum]QGJ85739.1 death on curing protein [Streptococcus phage phi-SsuFJSM7_rum]QGJ86368.1 death on curing protein [Streptococcus phage phi-SsuSH0918_comEC]WAX25216.1 death-on-curing protein [Streptococcus phage YS262]WAX25284.1 death-on-curing p
MKVLTVEQVIELHTRLIQATGGLGGVRDVGLIESSLSSAFSTYFGVEKYPSIEEKAARLCYSLVNNHAFLDGNKRIGVFVMIIFLKLNGIVLNQTDEEVVKLGLGVASSELDYDAILEYIRNH